MCPGPGDSRWAGDPHSSRSEAAGQSPGITGQTETILENRTWSKSNETAVYVSLLELKPMHGARLCGNDQSRNEGANDEDMGQWEAEHNDPEKQKHPVMFHDTTHSVCHER